jgi:phage baseplate assembly protein W
MNGLPSYLAYPYAVTGQGVPQTSNAEQHVRDLILSVLFTTPGERVNMPTFGAGISRLVFAPNGSALITTAQFLISTNLQQWLSGVITVSSVTVSSQPGYEETVTIEITYTLNATGQSATMQVQT